MTVQGTSETTMHHSMVKKSWRYHNEH